MNSEGYVFLCKALHTVQTGPKSGYLSKQERGWLWIAKARTTGTTEGTQVPQRTEGSRKVHMDTAQEVSPEVIALAQKIQAKREVKFAEMKEEISERHPHALVDTLVYDEAAKKYKCRIQCTETGDESRWVFTSDLHQVDVSTEVSEKRKADKKAKKNEELKAARAFLASRKTEANQG